MNRITEVGITLSNDRDNEGCYAVNCWIRTEHAGYTGSSRTDRLTWTEAVDVMLVLTDENRPGDDIDADVRQSPLW